MKIIATITPCTVFFFTLMAMIFLFEVGCVLLPSPNMAPISVNGWHFILCWQYQDSIRGHILICPHVCIICSRGVLRCGLVLHAIISVLHVRFRSSKWLFWPWCSDNVRLVILIVIMWTLYPVQQKLVWTISQWLGTLKSQYPVFKLSSLFTRAGPLLLMYLWTFSNCGWWKVAIIVWDCQNIFIAYFILRRQWPIKLIPISISCYK